MTSTPAPGTWTLVSALQVLTGEELYELARALNEGIDRIFNLSVAQVWEAADVAPQGAVLDELREVRTDALLNMARIQVPLGEAQKIIWRQVYSRGRPWKVVPDYSWAQASH